MQVVGRSCEQCDSRIASIDEGFACPKCDAVWHTRCLPLPEGYREGADEPPPICPGCGVDFNEAREEEERAQAQEVDDLVARGRRIFYIGVGPIVLANLAIVAMSIANGASPITLIGPALVLGFMWMIWRGARWARILATVHLAVGAAAALLFAAFTDETTLRLVFLGVAALDATYAGTLLLSESLYAFLMRQARENGYTNPNS